LDFFGQWTSKKIGAVQRKTGQTGHLLNTFFKTIITIVTMGCS
jgi:hypothetical protein